MMKSECRMGADQVRISAFGIDSGFWFGEFGFQMRYSSRRPASRGQSTTRSESRMAAGIGWGETTLGIEISGTIARIGTFPYFSMARGLVSSANPGVSVG